MHRKADRGFTIVEVLIVVTLMGVLSVVLSAAVIVVLRTNPSNAERVDDARVLQGITTWLPQDIDSTPTAGFVTDPMKAADCAGSHAGTNLLHLTWTETVGASTRTWVANYRHVPNGSIAQIQRITCHGTGTPPYGSDVAVNSASGDVAPLPTGWTQGTAPARVTVTTTGGEVTRVEFEVTAVSGKVVRIEAAPKNPAATLPPVTTTTAVLPTTTTAVTTTTVAPTTTTVVGTTTTAAPTTTLPPTTTTVPCVITGASPTFDETMGSHDDGHVETTISNGQGPLRSSVDVTISWTGGCTGLKLRYDPTVTGAPGTQSKLINFATSGGSATTTLEGHPSGSDTWELGAHQLQVLDGATTLLTLTLTVHGKNSAP
jgi:prepilin-type N-terminal cleavage/methylation domain-containing protein